MARVTVSLTDEMKTYIDTEIENGNYGNTSEYIRDLIRHERERQAKRKLELLIKEGLNSGDAIEWNVEEKERIMKSARAKAKLRAKK